jgi:ribosomal protein L40E
MRDLKLYGGLLFGIFILAWIGKGLASMGEKVELAAPWWAWSILLGVAVIVYSVFSIGHQVGQQAEAIHERQSKQISALAELVIHIRELARKRTQEEPAAEALASATSTQNLRAPVTGRTSEVDRWNEETKRLSSPDATMRNPESTRDPDATMRTPEKQRDPDATMRDPDRTREASVNSAQVLAAAINSIRANVKPTKKCGSCGAAVSQDATHCRKCLTELGGG